MSERVGGERLEERLMMELYRRTWPVFSATAVVTLIDAWMDIRLPITAILTKCPVIIPVQ
jgi:hypothetical protein